MRHIHKLISVLLITLLLVGGALPVAAEDMEFTISVTGITDFANTKTIRLDIDNDTGSKMSFGWVGTCEVLVTTTEGTYSMTPHMLTVAQGNSSHQITVPNCPGEVQKIKITDLRLLSDDGLPEEELKDIVIYNAATGKTSYSGEFEESSKFPPFIWVGIGLFAVIFIGGIVLMIVLIKKQKKGAAATAQTFAPFAGNGAPGMDMAQQMHDQAHHQFMNQVNQQQVNDFTHKSGTTMDMGGFIPPPPPPPPGL